MANIRVKDLPNTDTLADADELIVDSSSAGTRRVSYSELKTEVAADYVAAPTTYKVAPLNSSNKIDATYLPTTGDTAKGGWNASTNTPTLANGTGTAGDYYDVTTAGLSLGISFTVGDVVKYDGANWFKIDSVSNIFDGISTVDQVKTLAQVPDIGLQPNQVPLNGFLNSGAYLDFDAFYQTGTWNGVYAPATGTFASVTMDADLGYVKNGKLVTVSGQIKTDAIDTTGGSGQLKIDGLPFAAAKVSAITIGFAWNWGSSFPLTGYISGSSIRLLTRTSTTARTDNFDVSGMSTGTNADRNLLYFSGTYQIA